MVGILIYFYKDNIALWIIQNNKYGLLLFITFLGLVFQSCGNYYLSFLKNTGNAKLNVGIVLITSIIGFILNIYFVSVLKIGPIGLSFGLLISNAIIFIAVTTYFLKLMGFGLKPTLLFNSLKLSLPLVPTGVISIIGKSFDKYIISVLASVGGVGTYAISHKISNLSFTFMTTIQKVYSPIVYQKMFSSNSMDGDNGIGKYLTPFAYFSVAAAFFVSLFSEEALIILAPQEYLKGLSVINIFCISFSISFFAKQPQLMYAGKTGIQSILSIINFIITVVVLYLFVNKFGIMGAAIGNLIVSIIYNALLIRQGQKYYKIDYEWIKLVIIYTMLAFTSISVLILYSLELAYLYRFIIKIIYLGIFIKIGFYLKILTKENLLLIFNKKELVKV